MLVSDCTREALSLLVAEPEFINCGKPFDFILLGREEVVFDNVRAVGGVREPQAQNRGVILGLLKSVTCRAFVGLGFDHRQSDVPSVSEQEVGDLFLQPSRLAAGGDDPAIGERRLLVVEMLVAIPAG